MAILTLERITVGATAVSKEDAIRQAGQLLVESGCVSQEYVTGMHARENTMSTYLGNGVAIPHGTHESIQYIQKAGISVVQLPNGVEWEDDEKAHLVIGIAAASDEHMGILTNLAEVVEDEDIALTLGQTATAEEILNLLNRQPEMDA
ncbi:MAG: PTS sugar transporter subunit IIA [Chloroflexota bacterium]